MLWSMAIEPLLLHLAMSWPFSLRYHGNFNYHIAFGIFYNFETYFGDQIFHLLRKMRSQSSVSFVDIDKLLGDNLSGHT
jgi:hypothetical protein